MKKFLFLLIAMSAIFLISCGDDGTTTETKTCDPTCESYQTCDDGTCKLTEGKCATDTDCASDSTKPTCDTATNTCVAEVTPECTKATEVTDCTEAGKSVCDANGVCVAEEAPECTKATEAADCTEAGKPVCDASGVCVAESTSDCVGLSFDAMELTNSGYSQIIGDYEGTVLFYGDSAPAGTYDLASAGVNDNYETCVQCVTAFSGALTLDDPADDTMYFQESGSITVTKGDGETGESAGSVTAVKLIEVTMADDGSFHTTPVTNGGCIEIETGKTWAWDNMPTCTENATRCSGDIVEKCDANDTWVAGIDCSASSNVCSDTAGNAICLVCEPDSNRCEADNVELCAADGSAWSISETCATPAVCVEATFTCVAPYECPEDTNANNTPADAIELTTFPVVAEAGFACSGVDDWYKVDLSQGDTIDVDLTFVNADGDIDIALFMDLPTVDSDPVAYGGSMDDNETFTFSATEAGTYYIKIVTSYVEEGVTYTMDITKTAGCTQASECTEGDANMCNAGFCVECVTDTDCTGTAAACLANTCFSENANGCVGLSFDTIKQDLNYGTYYADGYYNLSIEAYGDSPVGTYDLASSGVNDNYETCDQCVSVYILNDDASAIEKSFFQESGSLVITDGNAYNESALATSAGSVVSIKLIEVTIDSEGDTPTFHSTPVTNGECLEIETGKTWAWDSMPLDK